MDQSRFSTFFMETTFVARIYADSLRDNFGGYTPRDPAMFQALQAAYEAQIANDQPDLATLLSIEAQLIEAMPDDMVVARFWALDDRFRRVVPAAIAANYDRQVAPRGDPAWKSADFVRDQSRTLLDVIHANYLVNVGREISVGRLRVILLVAFLILVTIGSIIGFSWPNALLLHGLLMLAGAGMFGALLSIMRRLQSVTAADAMAQDGIYELTTLRIGWGGLLTSLLLGGGFALVLYGIVVAGLLNVAQPDVFASETDLQANVSTTAAPPPDDAQEANSAQTPPADQQGAESGVPLCPLSEAACRVPGGPLARELGLADVTALFRMLILAFLSGFAERYVPDMLNRVGKQAPNRRGGD